MFFARRCLFWVSNCRIECSFLHFYFFIRFNYPILAPQFNSDMVQDGKKRHVVSYENMSAELAAAFAEKYPKGFNDYLNDLVKYPKPDGTSFYAVTVEIPDAIYLVKIKVDVDDVEDLERWLEGEEEAEAEQLTAATPSTGEGDTLPDDNIAQYGSDDDPADGGDV